MAMMPKYPIYIPSKGRSKYCHTARFLAADGVPFRLVVEPQEEKLYANAVGPESVLVLPFRHRGSVIPARNWIKDHAEAAGHERHWQLDDNITSVKRWYKGLRVICSAGAAFRATEDFVDRYENVALAGLNYEMFCVPTITIPPFLLNARVYSCSLILNSLPHQFRGQYNEDTDFCLQVLADGWCTILVNAFMVKKITTMMIGGGNTADLYQGDGRLEMARSLERTWPGIVKTKRQYGRPQHVVDWRKFDTPLKRRADVDFEKLKKEANEYGMRLNQVKPVVRSKHLKSVLLDQGKRQKPT